LRPLRDAARPTPAGRITDKAAVGDLANLDMEIIMTNIGTFTAQNDGFIGTVRTLTLNVKVKFVPNDRTSASAPDFRIQAGNGYDLGAAWRKTSQNERPYLSVTLDDPSFPATIYGRLVEDEDGTHTLLWSRSKPKA
jgi:uncharacterized protein (DUF736 family)